MFQLLNYGWAGCLFSLVTSSTRHCGLHWLVHYQRLENRYPGPNSIEYGGIRLSKECSPTTPLGHESFQILVGQAGIVENNWQIWTTGNPRTKLNGS